jgi:hypothetical protein
MYPNPAATTAIIPIINYKYILFPHNYIYNTKYTLIFSISNGILLLTVSILVFILDLLKLLLFYSIDFLVALYYRYYASNAIIIIGIVYNGKKRVNEYELKTIRRITKETIVSDSIDENIMCFIFTAFIKIMMSSYMNSMMKFVVE